MDGTDSDDADLPNALVVDDEREVADGYVLRLRDVCESQSVYDGETALSILDDEEIDIVLLDRHMPGLSGDDVLEKLQERDYYGKVIMVTAIDPGFDVLDMPFDDYLCKPLEREDITTAIEQQCEILGYEMLGEYFSVASTRAVMEAELPESKLEDDEQYQRVTERVETLAARTRRLLDDADALLDRFETVGREGR